MMLMANWERVIQAITEKRPCAEALATEGARAFGDLNTPASLFRDTVPKDLSIPFRCSAARGQLFRESAGGQSGTRSFC